MFVDGVIKNSGTRLIKLQQVKNGASFRIVQPGERESLF